MLIDGLRTADLGAGGVRIGAGFETATGANIVTNSYIMDGSKVLYEGTGWTL